MVALQIRDVPDEVRDLLADRARAQGQSLQAFLYALLVEEARRTRNSALLSRSAERRDGSSLTADDASGYLRRERLDREAELHPVRPDPAPGERS